MLPVAACGGGGGSSSSADGLFSLGLIDGPVDEADAVVVQFDAVHFKPVDGDEISFTFDTPKTIDVLALQGGNSAQLLDSQSVLAGSYSWIRLEVSAEQDGVDDSYIDLPEGRVELRIPSGSQSGLKLVSGFTMAAGGVADFIIDFDLRKSLTNPPGAGLCDT